jgi:hypothetical protein
MRATCIAILKLFQSISLIIKMSKILSVVSHPASITSFHVGRNIFLGTLFLGTLSELRPLVWCDIPRVTHTHIYTKLWAGCNQGRTQGEGGCLAPTPNQTPQHRNLKNTDFVDKIILNILRDLPFRRNQPLESADG